jgi:hypothetical protein
MLAVTWWPPCDKKAQRRGRVGACAPLRQDQKPEAARYFVKRDPAVFQQMFEQNASMYLARSVGL